jgi:ACS family allantoate permease-like MFS transporter
MKSEKTSIEVGPVAAQDTQMRGDSMNEGTVGMVDILDTDAPFYRKLLKTIDWHLLPLMTAAYMIQFLDKQTLAQASIMGIVEDLDLVGNQFSWAGSIFYIGFLVASYPASMLMVRFPIAKYLAVTL